LAKFWKKKKEVLSFPQKYVSFIDWAQGKDFFSQTIDPWKRIKKLLVEIQKRTLSDQILLIRWKQNDDNSLHLVAGSPQGAKPLINSKLQLFLAKKAFAEKKLLLWEDLWEDGFLREYLKHSKCDTVLISPITIEKDSIYLLIVINYSNGGESTRVVDFIVFVSSVLSLSLQNCYLYAELKKKSKELQDWVANVEKRIEDETRRLLEKESQYHALFEGANDGILVHDYSGKLLEANRVACRLLGYEKEEMLSMNWNQLTISDVLTEQKIFFDKILKKAEVVPLETIMRKRDGSTFHAELSSRKVWFRGKEVIQTFIRDVSLRKALEESLRESKIKYRMLVESSLVGVFIIRNGIIQFVNDMFEKVTGYSKNELIEKDFFDLIVPEQRSVVRNRELRRERGESVLDHYEAQFLKKEGGRCWCEVRLRRVILDGEAAILGNIIDITQKKRLEMELLETQKMESIGTLAGGIAHDFNNLLGGILGYASLLLSDMPKDHPYYNDIRSIAETAKRAADLTNRLLGFARGGKYQVTSIYVNKVIEDIVAILLRMVDGLITIETSLEPNIWPLKGDFQQIYQALLNICLNGVEAMPEGGKLTITTSNVVLNASVSQTQLGVVPGDYVKITISDTGIGMDKNTKLRIFEPFFTTKQTGEGAGLGLAMVYGVIKNHGGSISVDSELGKGTKVTVFFPRSIEGKSKETQQGASSYEKSNRILLVDDEKVIREVARRMLEKGGFNVLTARNGREAVDIYKKNKENIGLVLLDLIMAEMGGEETYRKLLEIDPEVKVVFTSGYGPYEMLGPVPLGKEFFIQKPFQTEILIQKVRDILNASKK